MNFNYIALSKRYWRLHREESFSPSDSHLYWCLFHYFSEKGVKDAWPESLKMTDGTLALLAGISVGTLETTRKRLIKRGLINVVFPGQGNRYGNIYSIIHHDAIAPKAVEVVEDATATSPNIIEVLEDVSNQLPQSLPQSLPQNLGKSPIYIGIQTPNSQTQTKKEKESAEEIDLDSEKPLDAETPPTPPSSGPPPASPRGDPFTYKSDSEKVNVPFSVWWPTYECDVGKDLCCRLWLTLTDEERLKAKIHTPLYVKATPKEWRSKPIKYLDEKGFNDEIINRNGSKPKPDASQPVGKREIINTQYTAQKFTRSSNGRSG